MTSFLNLGEDYLRNNTLGPKQKTALNEYLRDAGFIERNRKSTELCDVVRFGYSLGSLPVLSVWAIVWTNLCHNSESFYGGQTNHPVIIRERACFRSCDKLISEREL